MHCCLIGSCFLLTSVSLVACSGFYMRCSDGRDRHFVPVPAAYVADIKEANEVFNIAPYPALYSDIGTLVPKNKLSDPDYVARPRTQEEMLQVYYLTKFGAGGCTRLAHFACTMVCAPAGHG